MTITVGDIVISRMGRDKDRLYAVIAVVNSDFVLVADGDYRKLDNPKLKRIKHLKLIKDSGLDTLDVTDSGLKKILKVFKA